MFTWRSYLEDTNGQAAPKENFLHFHKPPKSSELNGWKIGLKLEAVDRSNTSLICVATVTNVMDGRVLIHFDGWDLEYDYWVTPSSPYIHPKGIFFTTLLVRYFLFYSLLLLLVWSNMCPKPEKQKFSVKVWVF